jgi:hypothetical protein
MKNGRFQLAAALLVLALRLPDNLWAQAIITATLSGTVSDPAGGVVPGAQVSAKDLSTQVEYKTLTNDQGVYRLYNLPPATYDLAATAKGFQTTTRKKVQLFVNQSSTQDFGLTVGAIEQMVEVTGSAPTLQTGSSSLGTVIDSRKIVDLPLSGRQFTQLMLLTPGVSPITTNQDTTPGIGTRVSSLSRSAFVPSVNGQPSRSNLFFVDGILDTDPFFTSFAIAPSLDIIREFNVESHNDTAEVGQAIGGIVNVITKSGTDRLHGSAYEFNRNKAVEARNFFDPTNRPNFNQNQFGFTLGGAVPLWKLKGKTWFFGGYEGFRFVRGATIFSRVPTANEWGGDFSAYLGPVAGTDALGRQVRRGQVFNPFTSRATQAGQIDVSTGLTAVRDGFVREPFPNNIVPSSLFNSVTAWKRWVPAPNLPTTPGSYDVNFINTQSGSTSQDSWNVRVDHQINAKNSVYARYLYASTPTFTPSALPSVPGIASRDFGNLGVHWLHTFGPTAFLDLRFGYQHGSGPSQAKQPDDKEQLFKDAGFAAPGGAFTFGFEGNPVKQFPAIGIQDFAGTGSFGGFRTDQISQVGSDFTKIVGRHTIKLGGVWFYTQLDSGGGCPGVSFNRVPTADFTNQQATGNGLASFLLGAASGGLVYGGNVAIDTRNHTLGFYAQDSVKVTSRLTINYGLRWDFTQPPYEREDRLAAFDQATGKFVISGTTPPPDCAKTGKAPCIPGGKLPDGVVMFGRRGMVNSVYDNFAPRFGLAYRLNNRTVVRTGIGRYFDNWAFATQNTRDAAGWPFTQIKNAPQGLNERLFDSYAQFIVPPGGVIPAPTPFPAGRRVNNTDYKNGYVTSWNIDLQRQITDTLTVTGAYVGSKGSRLYTGFVQNTALKPGPGPVQDRVPFPLLTAPAFGAKSNGASWYNAFEFKAEQRLARGFSYIVSYTWQKSLDLGCSGFAGIEGCQIQDPYNVQADKSVSNHDIPHRIAVGYVWELPFGKGKQFLKQGPGSYVLGNWQVNGLLDYYSGQPVTILAGFDTPNTGGSQARPDQIGNPIPANRNRLNWFDVNAFQPAPDCRVVPASQCRFGTLGRNTLRGPGFQNWDFSVFRDFPMSEKLGRLQFRTEFFNLFNHSNFLLGGTNIGMAINSATFGKFFQAANSRQIQFAGKWIF